VDRILDYAEDSIPVLSEDKKILGVITSEDLIEMVDNEMGEDYAKLAGLTAEEDLKEPTLQSMGFSYLLTIRESSPPHNPGSCPYNHRSSHDRSHKDKISTPDLPDAHFPLPGSDPSDRWLRRKHPFHSTI